MSWRYSKICDSNLSTFSTSKLFCLQAQRRLEACVDSVRVCVDEEQGDRRRFFCIGSITLRAGEAVWMERQEWWMTAVFVLDGIVVLKHQHTDLS